MSERDQHEGVLEEQDLRRPRIPPGTKAAILLLSFFVVAALLGGALLLIRDTAMKEAAALPRKEKNELPYRRPVLQPPPIQPEDKDNASARPAEQPQLEQEKAAPVPLPPQDIEDAAKQKNELVPKVLPRRRPDLPRENGEAMLDAPRHPIVGKPAPEIEGEDIDGKLFKLSDYRGKVVLLDFWGNW
ncbi:MAG TPA: hypothetical protein VMG10_14965 [Gemmataceae bacterium]|nr:hypothetical protein [Gemmataceae bacterium]